MNAIVILFKTSPVMDMHIEQITGDHISLLYNNTVIINPLDLDADCVMISGYPFITNISKFVEKGTIQCNKMIRELIDNPTHTIKVEQLDIKSLNCLNTLIVCPKQVFPVKNVKYDSVATELIRTYIHKQLINKPIRESQKYLIKYPVNNTIYEINVYEKLNIDVKNTNKVNKLGIITEKTAIQIVGDSFEDAQNLFKSGLDLKSLGIGGLEDSFNELVRRVFSYRFLSLTNREMLGLRPVKGLLLYGPPGCGKTLIARQIGKILNCVEPKIVNGPSLLNKYVGQSEENVRNLFTDAINDKNKNRVHLIICDEFDALAKKRGSTSGGTGVGDNVVNQFLTMIDGPKQLDNILLICMTNRKDLIDNALLRPGRLEVQIELGLPTLSGRIDILNVHTKTLRDNNRLCSDVNVEQIAKVAKNYTGAELEGLVKHALSYSISRNTEITENDVKVDENIIVCNKDFMDAVKETMPMFGNMNDISMYTRSPFICSDKTVELLYERITNSVDDIKQNSVKTICLWGVTKSGKTTMICDIAKNSGISNIRMVSLHNYLKEHDKSGYIFEIYDQVIKTSKSILILDSLEILIEWVNLGRRFNTNLLNTIRSLLKEPVSNKLCIFVICNSFDMLQELELSDMFDEIYEMPHLC